VADWWRARSAVVLRWEDGAPADAAPALLVSNEGSEVIDGLWIDVVVPRLPSGTIPTVDGVSVDYLDEAWGMRVQVGTVEAGQTRRISFVSGPSEEDAAA
jgi:hypothetical protein